MLQMQYKTYKEFIDALWSLILRYGYSYSGLKECSDLTWILGTTLSALKTCANIKPTAFYIVETDPTNVDWLKRYEFHIHLNCGKEIYIYGTMPTQFNVKFKKITDLSISGRKRKSIKNETTQR